MASMPEISTDGIEWAWQVATLYPAQGDWSDSEYLRLSESTNRLIEFTDGRLEFLTMPTLEHQLIVKFLLRSLDNFVEPASLGMVLFAPMPVNIRTGKYREPDIVFKFMENHAKTPGSYYQGADLVMEVVSDDRASHNRDYKQKVLDYAEAAIPEYWIVDPQEKQITVLTLDGDSYATRGVFGVDDQATSKLLEGFGMSVAKVFAAAKL